jgi:hypothetical protein
VIVAGYGLVDDVASRVGDVAFVPLRAASHGALRGLPGAWVWHEGAWHAGVGNGVLAALQWSVYLCGVLQNALTPRRGVDDLAWHAGAPGALVAAGDRDAPGLACVYVLFSWEHAGY